MRVPWFQMTVLEAIMRIIDAGRRPTIREIMKTVGHHSTTYVRHAIRELRSKGLVSFEDNRAATIRPRVRFIPERDL